MKALIDRSSAPVVDFQSQSEDALSTLLDEVKKAIPKVPRSKRQHFEKRPTSLEELNTVSFHVRVFNGRDRGSCSYVNQHEEKPRFTVAAISCYM